MDDFLSSASTADVGEPLDTEPESSEDSDEAGDKIFRFSPITESVAESGGQLGETEELSLKYLKRGYVTGEELLDLSGKLPDETRIRESARDVEGQRSFTTGAYIHQEVVGLRRNLRNHRWASELLARVMAASFPGKVFSSLAFFRDLKQPAHRDSTNGPWENLLLACTNFEAGGLWIQSEGGPAKRRILNKDMDGKVLRWREGENRLQCAPLALYGGLDGNSAGSCRLHGGGPGESGSWRQKWSRTWIRPGRRSRGDGPARLANPSMTGRDFAPWEMGPPAEEILL